MSDHGKSATGALDWLRRMVSVEWEMVELRLEAARELLAALDAAEAKARELEAERYAEKQESAELRERLAVLRDGVVEALDIIDDSAEIERGPLARPDSQRPDRIARLRALGDSSAAPAKAPEPSPMPREDATARLSGVGPPPIGALASAEPPAPRPLTCEEVGCPTCCPRPPSVEPRPLPDKELITLATDLRRSMADCEALYDRLQREIRIRAEPQTRGVLP